MSSLDRFSPAVMAKFLEVLAHLDSAGMDGEGVPYDDGSDPGFDDDEFGVEPDGDEGADMGDGGPVQAEGPQHDDDGGEPAGPEPSPEPAPEPEPPAEDEEKAKYNAGCSAGISGTNMFIPGGAPPSAKSKEKARMGRDNTTDERVARYAQQLEQATRENKEMKARVEILERNTREAQLRAEFNELKAEGYNLDVEEEIWQTANYTREDVDKHKAKIRARYTRSVASVPPIANDAVAPASGAPEPKEKEQPWYDSAEEIAAAIDHCVKIKYHDDEDYVAKYRQDFRDGKAKAPKGYRVR